MIKFDLEKALAGENVVTRVGQPITQLVKFKTHSGSILYGLNCDMDSIESWLLNGNYHDSTKECDSDLFMAPKKLSGFVNVYRNHEGRVYMGTIRDTKEECIINTEDADHAVLAQAIDLSQFEEGHGL